LLGLLHLGLSLLQLMLQLLDLRLLLLLLLLLQLNGGHRRLLLLLHHGHRRRLAQWLWGDGQRHMRWRGLGKELRRRAGTSAVICPRSLRRLKSIGYLLEMSPIQLIQIDGGSTQTLLQMSWQLGDRGETVGHLDLGRRQLQILQLGGHTLAEELCVQRGRRGKRLRSWRLRLGLGLC